MSTNERLAALSATGVSIWLDDLSRERLNSRNLQSLIADSSVVGVTTNPTIFATALPDGRSYDAQVRELAARGKAGIANSRLAYAAFQETFQGTRWAQLTGQGAVAQRPLWRRPG